MFPDAVGTLRRIRPERTDIGDQIAGVGPYAKLLESARAIKAGTVQHPELVARDQNLDVVCGERK
jgi:hypothetical protein